MSENENEGGRHRGWAHLRFAVVGSLLASPPARGMIEPALRALSEKLWRHPQTGKELRFGVSTIERWYYRARHEQSDPVRVLRRKVRRDLGREVALSEALKEGLLAQYREHPGWSAQLHADNLGARIAADPGLGRMASYASVRRFLRRRGLHKRRGGVAASPGVLRAEQRLDSREVRSFEVAHVHGLWHLDFHHGSRPVLTTQGQWVTPQLLGVLDDRSRLCCHAQWYLAETAECLVHGLSQAIMKRGLPRALMSDNGSAMIAGETRQGLARLGIVHRTTLPHSPYQNGKQENFWTQIEGRLMAMLEGATDLTLALLNHATQAWVELEYHRRVHGETQQTPIERLLAGPAVGRPSPTAEALRHAFVVEEERRQRRTDGTLSVKSVRFEIPNRYRHLVRLTVRYASWDLSSVLLVDARTDTVLCHLSPLDKTANADARRRALDPVDGVVVTTVAPAPQGDMAELLRHLLTEYAATGLPPAYLPTAESLPQKDPPLSSTPAPNPAPNRPDPQPEVSAEKEDRQS